MYKRGDKIHCSNLTIGNRYIVVIREPIYINKRDAVVCGGDELELCGIYLGTNRFSSFEDLLNHIPETEREKAVNHKNKFINYIWHALTKFRFEFDNTENLKYTFVNFDEYICNIKIHGSWIYPTHLFYEAIICECPFKNALSC